MSFLILFLFINLAILLKIEKTILGPGSLFTFLWLFSILLYVSGVLYYYPASTETLVVLFGLFTFFYIGYYICALVFPKFKMISPPRKKISSYESRSIEFAFYFILVLLAVRVVSVVFGLHTRFGSLAEIFANGDMIYNLSRTGEWSPGIPVVLPVENLAAFFTSYRFIKANRFDVYSYLSLFLIIVVTTSLQSRYMLMLSFFAFIAPLLAARPALKLLTGKRFLMLCFLSFVISASRGLTSAYDGGGDKFMSLSFAGEIASYVYYGSSGIAGLDQYILIGEDQFGGVYSLNGLLGVIQLLTFQDGLALASEEVNYYTPTRTIIATGFKFLIDDFGFFSIFVLLIFGFFTRYFYLLANKTEGSASLFLFSIIYMSLGYSWFSLSFFNGGFWMYIISGALLLVFTRSNALRLLLHK